MNNDNFLIEMDCLYTSQQECNGITDSDIRSRAVANIFASEIAKKYFEDKAVDTKSGIHNVKEVLNDIDISDIYIKGNYIDVRVYFNDNELCVPKSHFEYNMLPIAYMFIKLDPDFSTGEVTGFLLPEYLDLNNLNGDYYNVDNNTLVSYYDIDSRLVTVDDEGYEADFRKKVFDFLDGALAEKEDFYKTLVLSESARDLLLQASKSKTIFGGFDFVSITKDGELQKDELPTDTLEENATEPLEIESGSEEDMLEPLDTVEDDLTNELPDDNLEIEDYSNTSLLEESETANGLEELDELNIENSETEEDALAENPSIEKDVNNEPEQEVAEYETVETTESVPNETNLKDDDIAELSEFDYSTEIMPSISSIEEETDNNTEENTVDITEEILNEEPVTDSEESKTTEDQTWNESEQIDKLFNNESPKVINTSKKKNPIIPLLGIIILLGAAGFYGYTQYNKSVPDVNMPSESLESHEKADNKEQAEPKQDAMPIETVENVETAKPTEEASTVSIPAIEQNLNASIQVSNLTVNWEVPTGYANNATAKRYFLKVGKVLQLNVKAELLMLSKSPITNKISVELEFNKDTNRFEIKRFINSSGVTVVDNVVKDTVKKVLDMNMNMNMGVFSNLSGNPILVINL